MLTRVLMAVVPTLVGIAVLVHFILRRNRASGWFLFYAAVGFGLGLLGYRGLARQIDGHRCITTLDPDQLRSITILGRTFEDPASLASITRALKTSTWFVPSHTNIVGRGDFEIHKKTGQVVQYQIGFIKGGQELLIFDSGFAFQDANKDLIKTLQGLRR